MRADTRVNAMESIVVGLDYETYKFASQSNGTLVALSQPHYESLKVPTKRKFFKVKSKRAKRVKFSQLLASK